jgi:hypothetical protein
VEGLPTCDQRCPSLSHELLTEGCDATL